VGDKFCVNSWGQCRVSSFSDLFWPIWVVGLIRKQRDRQREIKTRGKKIKKIIIIINYLSTTEAEVSLSTIDFKKLAQKFNTTLNKIS